MKISIHPIATILLLLGGCLGTDAASADAAQEQVETRLERAARAHVERLNQVAAEYDAIMAIVHNNYDQALIDLTRDDRADDIRRAAAVEQRRFKHEKVVPDEIDKTMLPEIKAARATLRRARLAADQTRLRRTLTLLDFHLRALNRLIEDARQYESDAHKARAIRAEIEKNQRIRRYLMQP